MNQWFNEDDDDDDGDDDGDDHPSDAAPHDVCDADGNHDDHQIIIIATS